MKMIVAVLAVLLSGCVTGTPPLVNYVSDSAEAFPAKPNKYDPPIFDHRADLSVKVIGHAFFSADSWEKGVSALKKLAREHGADAIVIVHTDQTSDVVPYTVPPSVEYHPVTTTETGTLSTTDPYGYPTGTGVYSGTQTSQVPVVNPGYSGVATINLISGIAQFVVFN